MSVSHPLEGDGLIINIFLYLWKKKVNTLSTGLGVKIPPTVVYEHNFPKGWYFYSEKKEEIERKVGKEIDTKAIFKEFSKKHKHSADLDVVASYMSKSEDSSGQETTVVEYFDKQNLQDFLTKRTKRDQGILQRFIPPNGKHNVTIQAIWSPHVTMVEKRQNITALNDRRYDIFERTITYEGPSHYSREAFVAPHIKEKVQDICERFTAHFYNTEHMQISRMVLYFKVDRNSDLWLLWSSSLRIAHKKELNLAPCYISPRRMKPEEEEMLQMEEEVLMSRNATLGLFAHERTRSPNRAELTPRPSTAPKEWVPHPPNSARIYRPHTADDKGNFKISRHREAILNAREQQKKKMKAKQPVAAAPVIPEAPQVPRKKRNPKQLWYTVRKAFETKYIEVLYAVEQLHEFIDGLCYSMYSHFLTNKKAFYFNIPPVIIRFFGDQFYDRFRVHGIQKTDNDGECLFKKPNLSVVQLQQEFEQWRDEVCKPLLGSESLIFRNRIQEEFEF